MGEDKQPRWHKAAGVALSLLALGLGLALLAVLFYWAALEPLR